MTFSLKKYNLVILLTYLVILFALIVATLLYVDFEIQKIIEKSFLLSESEKFKLIIEKNYIIFSFFYIVLFIIFVSIIPFTLPGIILTSIIFNPLLGALISTICITCGSTIFFIFFIKSNLISLLDLKKIKENKIILKLKKNELISIFIFRITGGGGMPLIIQNIVLFYSNVTLKNFFIGTLMGTFPGNILISFLGIGIFEAFKRFILS